MNRVKLVVCVALLGMGMGVGCGGGEEEVVETGTTVVETGVTDTSETDTETTETGETTEPIEANASFLLPEALDGVNLTLHWVAFGQDEFAVGDALASKEADATLVEFELPDPGEGELMQVDPNSSLEIAVYAPALHVDADLDGVVDEGETITGAGAQWLVFANMDVPEWNVNAGWNSMIIGQEGAFSPFEIPISQNLLPDDTLELSGELNVADESLNWRAALVPYVIFAGEEVEAFLYDEPVTDGTWGFSLNEPAPADHAVGHWDLNATLSFELLVGYNDVNENGMVDGQDQLLAEGCIRDHRASAIHVGPPGDFISALSLTMQGLEPGWFVMESWTDGDGVEHNDLVDKADYGLISITEGCGQ